MMFNALQDTRRGYLMTLHAAGCQHVVMAPNRDDAWTFQAASVGEAVEEAGRDFAEPGVTHPSDWVEVAPCLQKVADR